MLLLGTALLDELQSGVPVVEATSLARELGIGHAVTALVLLVVPQIAGALLEARLLLAAERGDARRWIAAGQAVLASCLLVSAFAPSALWLGVVLAIAAPAGGVSCGLSEGCLVETHLGGRERAMARWMLAGALGDLAAPALVAVVALAGLGWRFAVALAAAAIAAHAVAVLRGPRLFAPALGDDAEDEPGGAVPTRRARLRHVLGRPALLLWLLGVTTCSLLDETFVVLAGSWLRDELGAAASPAAAALGLWAAGSATGAFATERLLRRFSARRVLAAGAALCAVTCLGWLAAPSVAWAAAGLFLVGLSSAPMWPIAMARAYATCPGRPALVGAAESLFVPLELALLAGAGQFADLAGTRVALLALVVQPVLLLGLALAPRRCTSSTTRN